MKIQDSKFKEKLVIPRGNFWCRISFDLAFLFLFLFILLFPFHQAATRHFNISQTIDSSHICFDVPSKTNITIGEELPVYRFNPDWKIEVGKVKVDRLEASKIYCSFNPAKFRWPMGRQGRISEILSADLVRVDLGHSLGLKNGDQLCLFSARRYLGKIVLTEVGEHSSLARVLFKTAPIILGLTVTEFQIPTQVVHFRHELLLYGELTALLLSICLYVFFYRRHQQSPFLTYGPACIGWVRRLSGRKGVRFAVQLTAGCFFAWFVSNIFVNTLDYLVNHLRIRYYSFSMVPVPLINFRQGTILLPLYFLGSLFAITYLLKTSRSPVLDFWDLFPYRRSKVDGLNGFFRDGIIWFLQGIIFYAFGSNLASFIGGNLTEVVQIAWPSMDRGKVTPFNPWDLHSITFWFQDIGRVLIYMITHKPDFWSIEIMSLITRYLLWTATCLSCLLAYLHSLVSVLWGFRIRNLDFTILGWFSNGACYPLLGFLIWPMVPSFVGTDPTITAGPWFYFMLFLDFYFNLLYTLSIWNLGLKFGVMTDKGVKTSGFYSVIRHPNYTLEAPMFLMVEAIGMTSVIQWLSASMWVLLYYIRSEREDHFMTQSNPDYLNYKQKTPYKFFPGVY